ncbi:MAG: STAS domain-containing protein [Actinomycetota bacterium]|nr:STAS domain-containing protein [Actinomycetota bacterium]
MSRAQNTTTDLPHAFQLAEETLEPCGLVLAISGELDIATAPGLRERLDAAIDSGVKRLVLDLSGVSFLDSVALAVIVNANRRLGDEGRMIVIVEPQTYVMLVFECSGLPRVLELAETREEAIAWLDD